jgi:ACS family glucarate transporter-like MFS transporter
MAVSDLASVHATPIDLAPPSAVASMAAIQNFLATISGLPAAIVTGYIVQATGSFVIALVVAGGVAMFGAISYLFIVKRFETLEVPLSSVVFAEHPA